MLPTHRHRPEPDFVSGYRALPARWPMRPAQVTTPAAERGDRVLRAKGKAGGGKAESSGSERRLDGRAEWENTRASPDYRPVGMNEHSSVAASELAAVPFGHEATLDSSCAPLERKTHDAR